ncbi:MAG: UDP-N-acetylmuramoyl-tripeptide--D-alanyl-D-alanine ligase [Patescibacteria group bacterium]|jgi:UDP-N-acetylmuramoyl-tripeptide--D-alanyl-D-alanine ligase
MIKKIIIWKLKFFSRAILKKYQPRVIGITGSVGKTSAREAIFCVVKQKFNSRQSVKNYNNEFGLPLSIIGTIKSPGKNLFGWVIVFLSALGLILFRDKNYPEVLVLEMGVDKPGDMDYLNSIIACDIAVLTGVGESHLENFSSKEKLAIEKGKIFNNLKKGGWAIFNFDNEKSVALANEVKNKKISYSFGSGTEMHADDLIFKFSGDKKVENLSGLSFRINYSGSSVVVNMAKIAGKPAVYASLAATAVGVVLGLDLEDIALSLGGLESVAGRMKLIPGIKNTIIIDDTYNASPDSCLAAIDFIARIETDEPFRRVAILGDMLELGSYSEAGHRLVGRALAGAEFDLLVTSGEISRDINRGAIEAGMSEDKVFNFANNLAAGKFAQDRIKKGDLILIKGSQGARMEKVVKELMADPLLAEKLLCRQRDFK